MRSKDPKPADFLPLTPAVLHILLALADGEQHGYAIAQAVEALTQGTVRMGPGTLYGSIGRMVANGLIEEPSRARGRAGDEERRRFYRLTALGRRVLESETDRLARVVAAARAKNVLRRPEPA
jgi:DNA-binding PadR family transcriptional regulator